MQPGGSLSLQSSDEDAASGSSALPPRGKKP
jgi:hypothetical protein